MKKDPEVEGKYVLFSEEKRTKKDFIRLMLRGRSSPAQNHQIIEVFLVLFLQKKNCFF